MSNRYVQRRVAAWLAAAAFVPALQAQLIPAGSPIPKRDKPPVVFLNGYQQDCGGSSFAGTFGKADAVLQTNGQAVVFFDNCGVANRPTLEDLGAAFGAFLDGLKFDDGTAVTTVDAVCHSMGGLILRSYLSGKKTAGGFAPPAAVRIRKAIFLATPHFGTPIASLLGIDAQVRQMATGTPFLFDLATWNQGTDDLRGVDVLAAIGNAGTGATSGTAGFDDGVVPLTSGSLGFLAAGRTRVLPLCHIQFSGLFAVVCPASVNGIANIQAATDPQAKLIVSFLNGTDDWRSVGVAAEDDPLLSKNGGLQLAARAADDSALQLNSASAVTGSGTAVDLKFPDRTVAYNDKIPVGALSLTVNAGSSRLTGSYTLAKAAYSTLVFKTGPAIGRVYPAASVTFPLAVAPGQFVAIYGEALAGSTATAASSNYPTQLADAKVTVGGSSSPLYFVAPSQIDAIIPDETPTGLTQITVQNTAGANTVNVMVAAAVPALFTQNSSGSGPASALNASRGNTLVTAANPLRAGDYVSLYLTGLGATTRRDGLDWAVAQPTVTLGGVSCPVSYAGRAPGYTGLDQINCVVPAGLAAGAAQVWVSSAGRGSNVATLAVQ
ncbi:MAG: hypothetical protein JSU00_30875 [Acidobacteria bacterium]|nr:hypothetical protein [Acidobacteriota bacterium]